MEGAIVLCFSLLAADHQDRFTDLLNRSAEFEDRFLITNHRSELCVANTDCPFMRMFRRTLCGNHSVSTKNQPLTTHAVFRFLFGAEELHVFDFGFPGLQADVASHKHASFLFVRYRDLCLAYVYFLGVVRMNDGTRRLTDACFPFTLKTVGKRSANEEDAEDPTEDNRSKSV